MSQLPLERLQSDFVDYTCFPFKIKIYIVVYNYSTFVHYADWVYLWGIKHLHRCDFWAVVQV
jgi:hypothetical protein